MEQEELKLTPYLRALWRRKWLIALTTLTAMAAGLGAAYLDDSGSELEARSVASATLRIEDQSATDGTDAVAALQLLTGGSGGGTQSVQTHIELIRSSTVMGRSVNKIREALKLPAETDERLLDEAAKLLAEDVRVSQVSGLNLLIVAATATDAEMARLRTDSIVAAYQQFLRDQKLVSTEDAIGAIDQRISESSQPALTSTRLKIILDQLSTSDLDRVELAINSSISQIESVDLSQFAETPSLRGLISELDAASARLEGVSAGLVSLENEIGSDVSASVANLRSIETVQGLAASSLSTIREVRSDYADASLAADLNAGIAELTNGNVTLNSTVVQLGILSNNLGISGADRTRLGQLRNQVQALHGSNASVANATTSLLNSGQAIDTDRQRLVTQLKAASSSLEITLTSLGEIRQTLSSTDALTQVVTVEGRLETVIDEMSGSALALEASIDGGTDSDLGRLESLLLNAIDRLDRVSLRLRGLDGGAQLLEAEIQSTAVILESVSEITTSLRTDPRLRIASSSVDLFSLEPELNTGVSVLEDLTANLAAGSSLSSLVLLDRVNQWSEKVAEASSEVEALRTQISDLDTLGPAEPILLALDTASIHLEDQAISMVSLGQVIDATANAEVSSIVADRMGNISGDLSAASGIFSSSANRMAGTAMTIRNMPVVMIGTALRNLGSAQNEYAAAAAGVSDIQSRASSGELLTLSDSGDIASRLQLVQAALAEAGSEISLVAVPELDLTIQNLQTADLRLRTLLAQLSDVETAETTALDDLFEVRRELQISVLGPQETGVSLVDTDVEEIAAGDDSVWPVDFRVIVGAFGGFILGLIGALMIEFLDRTVRRQEDIGDIARVSSLGSLPRGLTKGDPHPPDVTDDPTSVFSEAVHLVATQIQGRVNDRSRLLLISSPGPREGKTMMAINLARALSLRSLRVLLVDANFRKPDSSKIFEFADEPGLATALTQKIDPGEFIKHVEDGRLDVLPAGRSLVPPVELISRPDTGALLEKVRQQYDFVIIDGPPTLGFSESNALAKQAGAVIMVARSGKTKKTELREAMENLSGTDVLGVVMNFVSPKELAFLQHRDYVGGSGDKWRSRLLRPFQF